VASTRGHNRQRHAGFERNQQLYGAGQSDNQPGGWFMTVLGGRAGELWWRRGHGGAGLHGAGLDESHELAGPVYEQFTRDPGDVDGHLFQWSVQCSGPLLSHPVQP